MIEERLSREDLELSLQGSGPSAYTHITKRFVSEALYLMAERDAARSEVIVRDEIIERLLDGWKPYTKGPSVWMGRDGYRSPEPMTDEQAAWFTEREAKDGE